MSGTEVAAGAAVFGAGMQLYGSLSGAAREEEYARKKQILANQQADEMLARQTINEGMMSENARVEGLHVADVVGGAQNLGSRLYINETLKKNIELTRREANYKVNALRAGAELDASLSSDIASAKRVSGYGNFLGQAPSMYKLGKNAYGSGSASKEIPSVPNDGWGN